MLAWNSVRNARLRPAQRALDLVVPLPAARPAVAIASRTQTLPWRTVLPQAVAMWAASRVVLALFTYFSILQWAGPVAERGNHYGVYYLLTSWNHWDGLWCRVSRTIGNQRAETVARAALQYFKDRYEGQSPPFNAIYFRALRLLYPVATDAPDLQQGILAAMRSYADWAWDTMRVSGSNVNQFPDDYGLPQLLNQGALVSVLADLSACEAMSVPRAQVSSGGPATNRGAQVLDRAR